MYTVQDNLLARGIFGDLSKILSLATFIFAILIMWIFKGAIFLYMCFWWPLIIKGVVKDGRFYIGDFSLKVPIANIKSSPIKSSCISIGLMFLYVMLGNGAANGHFVLVLNIDILKSLSP